MKKNAGSTALRCIGGIVDNKPMPIKINAAHIFPTCSPAGYRPWHNLVVVRRPRVIDAKCLTVFQLKIVRFISRAETECGAEMEEPGRRPLIAFQFQGLMIYRHVAKWIRPTQTIAPDHNS